MGSSLTLYRRHRMSTNEEGVVTSLCKAGYQQKDRVFEVVHHSNGLRYADDTRVFRVRGSGTRSSILIPHHVLEADLRAMLDAAA
jgi:hypothetical protein